jgi:hypothetical protein
MLDASNVSPGFLEYAIDILVKQNKVTNATRTWWQKLNKSTMKNTPTAILLAIEILFDDMFDEDGVVENSHAVKLVKRLIDLFESKPKDDTVAALQPLWDAVFEKERREALTKCVYKFTDGEINLSVSGMWQSQSAQQYACVYYVMFALFASVQSPYDLFTMPAPSRCMHHIDYSRQKGDLPPRTEAQKESDMWQITQMASKQEQDNFTYAVATVEANAHNTLAVSGYTTRRTVSTQRALVVFENTKNTTRGTAIPLPENAPETLNVEDDYDNEAMDEDQTEEDDEKNFLNKNHAGEAVDAFDDEEDENVRELDEDYDPKKISAERSFYAAIIKWLESEGSVHLTNRRLLLGAVKTSLRAVSTGVKLDKSTVMLTKLAELRTEKHTSAVTFDDSKQARLKQLTAALEDMEDTIVESDSSSDSEYEHNTNNTKPCPNTVDEAVTQRWNEDNFGSESDSDSEEKLSLVEWYRVQKQKAAESPEDEPASKKGPKLC